MKILLIFMMLYLLGCSVARPIDYSSGDLYNIEYISPIKSEINIVDKTNIALSDIEYIDIKKTIEKDVQFRNSYIELTDINRELKFTYFPCIETEKYPTNSHLLNLLIHLGTFGLFPIGTYKTCQTDLDVVKKDTNEVLKHFSTNIKAQTGGMLYIYALPGIITLYKRNRIAVPARKLLIEFQESERAEKYEK